MLDKIKQVLKYIILPITLILAYIAYLRDQNRDLKEKAQEQKADDTIKETLKEEKEAQDEATNAVDEYARIRDLYLKSHGEGGDTEL